VLNLALWDLPIDFRKAWVSDSVFDISREKISEPASIVKGVSSPKLLAIPILEKVKFFVEFTYAKAVFPVPG
jgi:hypothetical protein